MADRLTLTRSQIAAFVGDDRNAIRVIEKLLQQATETTPVEVTSLTSTVEGNSLDIAAVRGVLEDVLAIVKSLPGLGVSPSIEPVLERGLGVDPYVEI